MVTVRYGSEARRLIACGVRPGYRGFKRARVGVEYEAGDRVAYLICGIDEASKRRVHDDGNRGSVCAVLLAACHVDRGRRSPGAQVDHVCRNRGVEAVRDVNVLPARVDGDRVGLIAGFEGAVNEEIKRAAALDGIADDLVGGEIGDIEEAACGVGCKSGWLSMIVLGAAGGESQRATVCRGVTVDPPWIGVAGYGSTGIVSG